MTTLGEMQQAFARALSDSEAAIPAGLGGRRAAQAQRRFAIYRNNVTASLIDALQESFPVTAALVGEEFFRAMAREFVRCERPRSQVLLCYGDTFPDFIAAFEPAQALPYLADVARIEAAWIAAYHAADAEPLGPAALAALGADAGAARVKLLPSVRLVVSQFPAGSIWLAHQAEHAGEAGEGPETVLVVRPAMEVTLRVMPGAEGVFATALYRGGSIEEAAAAALGADGSFDPGTALVSLLTQGAVLAFEMENDR